jgi:glycosyltransferase involved in cell wall biosynthesis
MPCPDDNHLAEQLGTLYDDRELLDKVAQDCYDRVTDIRFDWDTIAEQFDDVFQEVITKAEDAKPRIVKPKTRKKQKKD